MKVSAILVAAGRAERMMGVDKLSLSLGEYTVLQQSAKIFDENPLVSELMVVTREEKIEMVREALRTIGIHKLKAVTVGGETRFLSVQNGVAACTEDTEYFAIHDAARPFASAALITRTIEAAFRYGAAVSGVSLVDTVKKIDEYGITVKTVDRGALRAVATPQVFEAGLYRRAAGNFLGQEAFDDCEVVERYGKGVFVVEGEAENIKITTPADLRRINAIRRDRKMRVGHGYDVHKFADNRRLVLGGEEIPFEMGLLGHSDADVLTHAIMDALLGAAGLGDIGRIFPDTDVRYRDADSLMLLKEVVKQIEGKGYGVENVDATIVCQQPKLKEYIPAIQAKLSAVLHIADGAVNIKATTEEGLGFTGEMKGIAAHAVTLLYK